MKNGFRGEGAKYFQDDLSALFRHATRFAQRVRRVQGDSRAGPESLCHSNVTSERTWNWQPAGELLNRLCRRVVGAVYFSA